MPPTPCNVCGDETSTTASSLLRTGSEIETANGPDSHSNGTRHRAALSPPHSLHYPGMRSEGVTLRVLRKFQHASCTRPRARDAVAGHAHGTAPELPRWLARRPRRSSSLQRPRRPQSYANSHRPRCPGCARGAPIELVVKVQFEATVEAVQEVPDATAHLGERGHLTTGNAIELADTRWPARSRPRPSCEDPVGEVRDRTRARPPRRTRWTGAGSLRESR